MDAQFWFGLLIITMSHEKDADDCHADIGDGDDDDEGDDVITKSLRGSWGSFPAEIFRFHHLRRRAVSSKLRDAQQASCTPERCSLQRSRERVLLEMGKRKP